jgi:hypothetical protein
MEAWCFDDCSSHRQPHWSGHVPGRRVLRDWRVGFGELDLEESMALLGKAYRPTFLLIAAVVVAVALGILVLRIW